MPYFLFDFLGFLVNDINSVFSLFSLSRINTSNIIALSLPVLESLFKGIVLFDLNISSLSKSKSFNFFFLKLDKVNLIYVTNIPQSRWEKSKPSFPEKPKRYEFLVHKTIPLPKKTPKNKKVLKTSDKSSSLIPGFMNKKRVLKEKFDEEKKDNKPKKILYCFNCSWKFPERMSIIRKNFHINKCYEGNGKLDIMKYNEEQKLKLYRNYPNKKIIDLLICPICGKDIRAENNKTKQNHLHFCSKISLIK